MGFALWARVGTVYCNLRDALSLGHIYPLVYDSLAASPQLNAAIIPSYSPLVPLASCVRDSLLWLPLQILLPGQSSPNSLSSPVPESWLRG